jgi:hypothetical protein
VPSLIRPAMVDGAARAQGLALHALSPAGPHGAGSDWKSRLTDDADLPPARTTLAARYVRALLTCWYYRHQADANLPALIEAGRGDVPMPWYKPVESEGRSNAESHRLQGQALRHKHE